MNELQTLSSHINSFYEFLNSHNSYETELVNDSIAIAKLKTRESTLITLSDISGKLANLQQQYASKIAKIKSYHDQDMKKISELFAINEKSESLLLTTPRRIIPTAATTPYNNLRSYNEQNETEEPTIIKETSFKDALMKKSTQPIVSVSQPITISQHITQQITTVQLVPIPITSRYSIDAYIIDAPEQLTQPGQIYYIRDRNLFGIMIGNYKIFGNIGIVYNSEKQPIKIKDCHFSDGCTRADCKFFHDPLYYPKSRDIRNFVANSWLYTASVTDIKRPRFGSRDAIDTELCIQTPGDRNFFYAQLMHEILCGVLLAKYIKN